MSDRWTTNDNNFSNDIVSIKVNGTEWDVADTYARSQLLLRVDAPKVDGTAGQVLSLTTDGTAWIDAPSESIEYDAGDGLILTGTTFSVNWTTVAKKADIVNYTAGDGLILTGTTFSVNWTTVAKKADIVNYTAGAGISISNGVISCTLSVPTDYVTQATFDETIGDINSILDEINGEVL